MKNRHIADREVNSKNKVLVFSSKESKFIEFSWESVCSGNNNNELLGSYWSYNQLGEILKIQNGDEIPADILLLHSSSEVAKAYVDTSKLDG